MAENGTVLVLDPSGYLEDRILGMAPRPGDLRGKTLGVLDDTLAFSDVLLERIAAALQEQHGIAKVVTVRKPNLSAPTPALVLERLMAEVDVALVGVGG